jgi:Ala-tRNA(Pro) deacylase
MPVEKPLLEILDEMGIAWKVHEHQAVFTVEASGQLHDLISGAHTKNLFLKDAGGQFWLVTAPHDARVDLKALPGIIGSRKLSFAKAEDMERLLGVSPGSVTPLAAMNDEGGEVRVVIDSRLAKHDWVNVHPLRNTATIGLSGSDLAAFLRATGHDILIVEVPAPL